jgi:phosphomethylpyrimidine synthase
VRISKEIQEFASGKDEAFQRGKPVKSAALTPEQQEILEKRGVLSPEEIHRLASKTKKAVGAAEGKASCHSDFVDPETAQAVQAEKTGEKLVQVNLGPAYNIPDGDRVV